MSFGWSASDVVAALELLNKVRIALNDCGGASSEYQAECSFLQTLSITLGHLKTLKAAPLEPGISENISELLGQIEQPVRRFLDDIERTFGSSLGVSSTRRKLLTAPRKIQWALVVADRAKVLREKIGVPLSAILAAMSQQIIQTSLQMPVDIQSRLVDSIDSAVDSKLRPSFEAVGSEVAALSRQYHVSSSQILDSISTLKETTLEAFSKQHAKTCEGAIELLGELDKAISTRQASIIDTQQKIYNRVQMTAASTERELRASTEATQNSIRVLHQHTTDSFRIQDARNRACAATLHSKLDHMNSLLGLMGDFMRNMSGTQGSSDLVLADQGLTQAFQTAVRSLWVLVLSLQSLVKELMFFLAPYLICYWRTMLRCLRQCSIPQRLLTSLGNGVGFEDAIGRYSILPFDYIRTWEGFNRTLQCWFHGFPGEHNVKAGLYLILNTRRPDQVITKQLWEQLVTPGANINMSMIVRRITPSSQACPRCNSKSRGKRFGMTSICTSCSLQYNSASAAAVSVGEENDAEISTFLGDIRRRKHSSAPAMEKVKSTNAPVKRIAMFQGPSDDSNKEEPVRADNEKDLEAFKRVHMLTGQEISSLQGSATRGPGIVVYDTWTSNEYDRRGDIGATCNRLSHVLAQHIKEELNTFKMEMEVHEDSKIYTHFF